MQERVDRELRERFAGLRAEVDGLAPPFSLPAAHRAPRKVTVVWAAAAVLLLTVVGTWYVTSRTDPQVPYAIDLTATAWEAPTDFLLATPGSALLDSIPVIAIEVPALVAPTLQAIDTSI
jgi:hypothetical protein